MRHLDPKLPNLPRLSAARFVRFRCLATFLYLLLALQAYFHRIFSPSNIRISPLLLLRLFGFSFANRVLHRGGLRSPSSPNRSSCGRSDGPNSTHWCCQMFRRHFYRVCDLSTINVVPVWISLTPVLSLLLHQSTTPTDSKLLNHKHPSTFSQHAFRVRKTTEIETPLLPLPPKQSIASNERKI